MHGIVESFWAKFNEKEKEILVNAYLQRPLPLDKTEIAYLKFHRLLSANNTLTNLWILATNDLKKASEQ